MNAANAIGLGSCWVNRAKEVFEMPEAREILRKAGIGDEYIGIGHCLLGYVCGDKPAAHPRATAACSESDLNEKRCSSQRSATFPPFLLWSVFLPPGSL